MAVVGVAFRAPSYYLTGIDLATDLQLSMTPRCLPQPRQTQLFEMQEVEMVSLSGQVLQMHALENRAKFEPDHSVLTWVDDLLERYSAKLALHTTCPDSRPGFERRIYSLHVLGVEAAEVTAGAETLNQMSKP